MPDFGILIICTKRGRSTFFGLQRSSEGVVQLSSVQRRSIGCSLAQKDACSPEVV
jgi:hypothetical protein